MPALVVLDDLHLLCPAPSQAPEAALTNVGSAALAAWLRDVLKEYHARPEGRPALPGMSVGLVQNLTDTASRQRPISRNGPLPSAAGPSLSMNFCLAYPTW